MVRYIVENETGRTEDGLFRFWYAYFVKQRAIARRPVIFWTATFVVIVMTLSQVALVESLNSGSSIDWLMALGPIYLGAYQGMNAMVASMSESDVVGNQQDKTTGGWLAVLLRLSAAAIPVYAIVYPAKWLLLFIVGMFLVIPFIQLILAMVKYRPWDYSERIHRTHVQLNQYGYRLRTWHLVYYLLAGVLLTGWNLFIWRAIAKESGYDPGVYGTRSKWLIIMLWGHGFSAILTFFAAGLVVGGLVGLWCNLRVIRPEKWPIWLPGEPIVGWRIVLDLLFLRRKNTEHTVEAPSTAGSWDPPREPKTEKRLQSI
jgi:hypothetical protein